MSSHPDNLVQSFLDVVCGTGEPHSYAVDHLNQVLGTHYTLRRLYEWRAGSRAIPQAVQDCMLRVAIESVIMDEIEIPRPSDEAVERMATRLCPPPRSPAGRR